MDEKSFNVDIRENMNDVIYTFRTIHSVHTFNFFFVTLWEHYKASFVSSDLCVVCNVLVHVSHGSRKVLCTKCIKLTRYDEVASVRHIVSFLNSLNAFG